MKKDITESLAWAGGMIGLALAGTVARELGYVDGDTVIRVVVGANGLMIAWFGNRAPKAFVPDACARKVARVSGWSLVLSGLVYAAAWAFAPIPVAVAVGCGAVLAGIAVTFAYGWRLRTKAKAGCV